MLSWVWPDGHIMQKGLNVMKQTIIITIFMGGMMN